MRFRSTFGILAALMTGQLLAQDNTAGKPEMQTLEDKVSYGIGINFGKSIKEQGVELNFDFLVRGLSDGLNDRKSLISDKDMAKAMKDFQVKLLEKIKMEGEKNKKAGEAFLAANKKQPNVKTTESGLQYKVLKQGTGPKPTLNDVVLANYRGTLLSGKEFDSSAKAGRPVPLPVENVIPGWIEALQLMPVGSKWQLWIPADLAYGEMGFPPGIPPNSTLIFELELVDIDKPKVPAFDEIPVRPSKPANKGGASARPPRDTGVQRTRFESGATQSR